ncbi:MAG: SDR family NAD(P)-dependent oxidoreductase [Rhizobiaceae bacterium]|nr:SDR family NAD(P)-dependent oxidoreductase [Rhizobiaceae bacterium]
MINGSILVSGGASGLGAAVVAKLSQLGSKVASVDLTENSDLTGKDGCASYICDVTDAEKVTDLCAQISNELGPISAVICCAGIAPSSKIHGRKGPHDVDLFEKVLSVNVVGTFNLIRAATPLMKDNQPDENGQRGVFITTASVAAFEGQIGQIAYAASKGAIASMTLPIARELARDGIRCVSIAPGVFDTPMMQGMPEEVRQSIAETIPFPAKLADPDDYASLVSHILENKTLNGEVIRLDGALRMAGK